ncbi:LysR family transcriptional regulator [Paraburkholderia megapolitana]|uniref:Transcriptional regulator, LysR family n=1 Tax=Paraburkholderia megapolitana TaxID=420953 RepID=A0A1I3TAZ0_9BURK|nr:LysR family transcriptional regulator [Paraburkholderia megapolitana]QDQ81502.1 LysR family transcriptional regulator [Paraburkholderia megapolitana]SFJ67672.1 transcriptional regulator, LysR family [Paraburkholderia megapolitana]
MIDRIQAMRTFVRIVDTNSFSRAAESLDMPRATATTVVQNLEALLGTALLTRTTRRLSLTTEGAAYYERCAQILADIDELEAGLRGTTDALSGRLRVEMPGAVATELVLPALDDFHMRFPNVDLAIGISNRSIDHIAEAVDCSILLGELPDSGLVARRLGTLDHVTCASPAYLERYGTPLELDDLATHIAVNCMSSQNGRACDFDFEVGDNATRVKVNGFVKVSDEHAYLTCGLQGLGLIQPSRIAAQAYLDSGALREVLPQWKPVPMAVSVAYVKSRRVSPRVRAFVDWLAQLFEQAGHVEKDLQRVRQLLRGGLHPA